MRRFGLLLACAIACRGAAPRAPDPEECATAADCAPSPLFDPDQLCCSSGLEVTVRSKAWLDWYAKFHAERCAGVTCPVLPPPAPPLPCATQARCVQHRCTDSCSGGSGAGK